MVQVPGRQMEVSLVRGVFLAAGAALVFGTSPATAQDKPVQEQEILPGIPASAMPPEGMCRVWLKDVPVSRQPAATDCASAIKSRPRDAMLLLGEPSRNAKLPVRRSTRPLTSIGNGVPNLRANDPMFDRVDRSASLQRQGQAVSGAQAQRPGAATTTQPAPAAVKPVEAPKASQVKPPPQE